MKSPSKFAFFNLRNMNRDDNFRNSGWWYWLLGLIALISGLWVLVKGCHQQEISNRLAAAVEFIDSASVNAEDLAKTAIETLDSAALLFKEKWKQLGNNINVRLGQKDLAIPEKGVEVKLLDWLQNKANKIDKTTWFNFDRILFDEGSASLNKVSDEQIQNIATIMKAMPKLEFKIGGYTDSTGNATDNLRLSLARAQAVRNALIEAGIDENRLVAEGYGSEHPVADNSTEEGRERNRRVAIRVTRK